MPLDDSDLLHCPSRFASSKAKSHLNNRPLSDSHFHSFVLVPPTKISNLTQTYNYVKINTLYRTRQRDSTLSVSWTHTRSHSLTLSLYLSLSHILISLYSHSKPSISRPTFTSRHVFRQQFIFRGRACNQQHASNPRFVPAATAKAACSGQPRHRPLPGSTLQW